MNQVDRLQWPKHHLEFGDLSGVIPPDHVDAVDAGSVQFKLEFKYGIAFIGQFTDVTKRFVEKNVERGGEILLADGLAHLGRMHHRRIKDRIRGEQPIKSLDVALLDQSMPNCDGTRRHKASPSGRAKAS